MDKFLRHKLVSRLKGFEQEAKMLRTRINKAKDKKRPIDDLQCAKQIIGVDARHHLLAYAFLRKMPYHVLEPHCRPDNKPRIELILTVAESFFDWTGKAPSKERVEKWLAGTDLAVKESTAVIEEKPETEEVIQEQKPSFLEKAVSFVVHGINGIR